MPHIRLIEPDDADGLLKEEYDAAVERADKVFNIVKAMSLNPEVLKQSMEMYRAIMFGPSESHPGRARAARDGDLADQRVPLLNRLLTPTTSVLRAQMTSSRDMRSMTIGAPTSSRASALSATTPSS